MPTQGPERAAMSPLKISSFSIAGAGGNPAGVLIAPHLPAPEVMQNIAADLGYSETAFAAPDANGAWRVRYYAPVGEVAFCGHATIALGAALGAHEGAGVYHLNLRDAAITVEAFQSDGRWCAALQSPPTSSKPLEDPSELLALFGLGGFDLDPRFAPRLARAGANFAIFMLKERAILAHMSYPFDKMRAAMARRDLVTISLLVHTGPRSFASRNAFASGGVVEDPATGAAAAALGGALVDLDWDGLAKGGTFHVMQGEDMGYPSRIEVAVTGTLGASVRVSGETRLL